MRLRKRQRSDEEQPVLELVEEAFHLVRRGPALALSAYGLGTLPFVLALLFFWSDMAHSAFAEQRLLFGSLGLTLLFLWMKTWQSVSARHWLAWLSGEAPPRWTARWLARTGARQAMFQPFGLFVLPVCLVLVAPFAWAYPFFTNLTVFGGGETSSGRALIAKARRQAALWPAQNFYLMFVLKLFGLFVFLNLLTAVMAAPFLMKTLLGVETVFSRSPWAMLNSTLLLALVALAYVCLDPIVKATYTLRCFYGESIESGADLRADLKRLRTAAGLAPASVPLLVALLCFAPDLPAQTDGSTQNASFETQASRSQIGNPEPGKRNTLSPTTLDRTIGRVIQRREYSWRLPRDPARAKPKNAESNWLERFFQSLEDGLKAAGRWIGDVLEWLTNRARPATGPTSGPLDLAAALRSLLVVLLGLLAGLSIWLLVRIWRRGQPAPEVASQTVPAVLNLADESTGADQLPEDGWIKLARELLERGESRLALRAFYLAILAHLAERNLITLARFKSNRDYERELGRRGHALAELPALFAHSVAVFERIWYGLHEATPETVQDFRRNAERIQGGA